MRQIAVVYPIVLDDGGDIATFASPSELLLGIEGIDVRDNVYDAWDSSGRVLRLNVIPGGVGAEPTQVEDREGLLCRLLDFIERVDDSRLRADPDAELQEMVRVLDAFLRE